MVLAAAVVAVTELAEPVAAAAAAELVAAGPAVAGPAVAGPVAATATNIVEQIEGPPRLGERWEQESHWHCCSQSQSNLAVPAAAAAELQDLSTESLL